LVQKCVAKAQGRVESLPQIRPRPATTQRRFVAFVLVDKGKVLVRQRPAGAVNAHLWEFPNIEVSVSNGDPARACRRALGVSPAALAPVATIRHSITRYRIRMDVFRITSRLGTPSTIKGRWLSAVELEELPFASAHKKVLHKLGLGRRALSPMVKTIDKARE
jgi:A/G-specific adenine glycosylase